MQTRRRAVVHVAAVLFTWGAFSGSVEAQTGTLTGLVVDAETAAPVANANVEILGASGAQATGNLTNQSGQFRFTLQAGRYSVLVTLIGYTDARLDGVRIGSDEVTNITIELTSFALAIDPIIVTASRREEKLLESPASVSIVSTEVITERPALTHVDHMKSLAGVDIVQTGLSQSNVVARGFNNVFSGALLTLHDNRYAAVPSLRLNAHNFIPITNTDIDRIEAVLGPGSALYGPNSSAGVLHIITKSPIDSEGTDISLAGGERSVFQGQFRHATRVSETVGFKVSGQYMRGNDWEFVDPREEAAKEDDPTLRDRNNDMERWGGEVRLDVRPDDDTEWIFTGGLNNIVSNEMTGIGTGLADGWKYWFGQTRFRKGRFFAQAFVNGSDAGDTFVYQTGQQIIDKSLFIAGQLQHAADVGDRQSFIYGLDIQQTVPRTEGAINGINEDDDNIFEIGGYLHSETGLSDRVDLVAALRVDKHSRLDDPNFSPRAALVFRPTDGQNFRVTYNRAFSTPSTNNLFLDILAGVVPLPIEGAKYDIRTRGVPQTGYTFEDRCPGGFMDLCMRSPFAAGAQVPADASLVWNSLVDFAAASDVALGPLAPFFKDPDPGEIQSRLLRFSQEEAQAGRAPFVGDPLGPLAIDRIKPTITNTIELGYKGLINDKVLLSADVWRSSIDDFVGPLRVETPTVFFDPGSVAEFLGGRITPLVQGGVVPAGLADFVVSELTATIAQLPVGTVVPDQATTPDLILTYRNFGNVDVWGFDLATQIIVNPQFSMRGSFSFVNEECFAFEDSSSADCSRPTDIALNAPKTKGSLSARYDNARSGLSIEGRVRGLQGFPMNSGVFVGDVEGYAIFDANVQLRLPGVTGAAIGLAVTNVLDDKHQEFVGAPEIGRLILGRVMYSFR